MNSLLQFRVSNGGLQRNGCNSLASAPCPEIPDQMVHGLRWFYIAEAAKDYVAETACSQSLGHSGDSSRVGKHEQGVDHDIMTA
jgi:hypothetical protein